MSTGITPYAEARQLDDGSWYVFWESGIAYGSIGSGLTEARAHELADKVRRGEVKP